MTDFDRLSRLDEAALRALLDSGDAVERLHALWALASRLGAAAVAGRATTEPSPGVRRQLCVVLAGEHLDLLVQLARLDTDAGVRGTASGLVTRLAAGGRLPWALVTEKLEDPAARLAVLESLPEGTPEPIVAELRRDLEGHDEALFDAALRALFRIAPVAAAAAARTAYLAGEPFLAERALWLWRDHAGAAAIHEALRDAPTAARIAALRRLPSGWRDVSRLALDPALEVRHEVLSGLRGDFADVPTDVLGRWIDSGWSIPVAEALLERMSLGAAVDDPERVRRDAQRVHARWLEHLDWMRQMDEAEGIDVPSTDTVVASALTRLIERLGR